MLICCGAAVCVVPWTAKARSAKGMRRFNRLWKERVALEIAGALWLVRGGKASLGCKTSNSDTLTHKRCKTTNILWSCRV